MASVLSRLRVKECFCKGKKKCLVTQKFNNASLSPSDLERKFVELFTGSYTPTPQVFLGAFTERGLK